MPKIFRSLAAAAAAVAAVIVAASSAGASVNPSVTVFTRQAAGFQGHGGGWLFRYVQAQVTLPDVTSGTWKAAIPGGYGASVRLADGGQTVDLGISTTPASGVYNAGFAVEDSDGHTVSCANGNSPAVQPGDTVLLTLFYNYPGFASGGPAGQVNYAVRDLTSPAASFAGNCADPGHSFSTVQEVAGFAADDYGAPSPAVTAPSGHARLVQLDHVVVSNRTGLRGSAGAGPWPVQKVAMTVTGGDTTVQASTPFAWGKYATGPDKTIRDGRNFAVWLPSSG